MTALYYLLGFLSGIAAALVVKLILQARRRRTAKSDEAFFEILNY